MNEGAFPPSGQPCVWLDTPVNHERSEFLFSTVVVGGEGPVRGGGKDAATGRQKNNEVLATLAT
ncbi:MAG: hypothetical protein U5K33_00865 [Halofilum sp. (in: g-proteobacteria)]|nr:hypothetical protein [Halofilum sp. (in: g-proteobacteria)]